MKGDDVTKTLKAALYLRVSTGEQTVENQRRELEAANSNASRPPVTI